MGGKPGEPKLNAYYMPDAQGEPTLQTAAFNSNGDNGG
jgi:hypothetical protein